MLLFWDGFVHYLVYFFLGLATSPYETSTVSLSVTTGFRFWIYSAVSRFASVLGSLYIKLRISASSYTSVDTALPIAPASVAIVTVSIGMDSSRSSSDRYFVNATTIFDGIQSTKCCRSTLSVKALGRFFIFVHTVLRRPFISRSSFGNHAW